MGRLSLLGGRGAIHNNEIAFVNRKAPHLTPLPFQRERRRNTLRREKFVMSYVARLLHHKRADFFERFSGDFGNERVFGGMADDD
jgi:hypothetical protein